MMRVLLAAVVMVLSCQSPASAQEAAAPAAPPLKPEKIELQNGDSIVFLGDSITHQRLYTQYVEDYFYTRFPHFRLKIHNAGVSGARAWDALQRFDQDVAAYKPKYVTILLGMNDGSYRPYDETTFQTYRQDMTTLLDQLNGIGAKAIPMTPTMYDSRAKRLYGKPGSSEEFITLYNPVLAFYGSWLREMAQDRGLGFVDMWSPLNNLTLEGRESDAKFTLIKDAIHPDAPGQVVMATAIIHDLELPVLVSKITIDVSPSASGKAVNGTLSDVTGTTSGVAFNFTAKALPWVLPPEAQLGAELTHLGHRFSRESLQVHGLSDGKYTLKINDVDVGTYTAEKLASGIELETNDKTPQYQQALKVAELNKKRNEGPIAQLRGEWSKFQGYARMKKDLAANPANQELAAKVASAEKAMEGLQQRVEQHNAAALQLEDEIFKINQPVQQRYVIEAVEAKGK
ncbi:SGNH/GDSL hydrolase family protein [Planctomicrobium piriforme]|uniref:Lysophospholipase L1 n=1 Tax=Planctomicrobium piriforme TaxID=1576369 RepID=A0A1I3IEA2_9PLAN|nr:SGNH/GDSL hydrolase family protein [Planctomicrobium piriforme]SFI46262.1 Lysophospholipase L1 [Planctomicrobium piriforme]